MSTRQILCSKQPEVPVQEWAHEEFAELQLGDPRRTRRLISIMVSVSNQPTASIPQACGSWAQTKAAYRFFDNPSVDPDAILAAHSQKTAQRAGAHRVILALQDTTSLNYSSHPKTQGLGPISNNPSKTIGFFVHSTLCVTPKGGSVGLAQVHRWARDAQSYQKQCQQRNGLPLQKKESHRWLESYHAAQELAQQCPQTLVVSVADREGDIYEVLAQATQATRGQGHAHVLIRSNHNRALCGSQGAKLWEYLAAAEVAGHSEISVRDRPGASKARVRLSVRFECVHLKSPILKKTQADVQLWAIEAKEENPPSGSQALHWRLLSSLPVESLESALEKIRWYSQRWQIEEFHKTLKSGCKIEERQLETRERLERLLAVDLISAWRIMHLTKGARESPDAPAVHWLSQEECQALQAYLSKSQGHKVDDLSLRDAVRSIAKLGGFLGRKGDGQPGPITLWRGLLRLYDITRCWLLFAQTESPTTRCG